MAAMRNGDVPQRWFRVLVPADPAQSKGSGSWAGRPLLSQATKSRKKGGMSKPSLAFVLD